MDTFELPPRATLEQLLSEGCPTHKVKPYFGKTDTSHKQPRKAGQAWTDEEHLAFLAGLKSYGRGNWRGIARDFVPSRTSTQIASHAQKYMARQNGATKRKSKFTDLEAKANQMLAATKAISAKLRPLQTPFQSHEGIMACHGNMYEVQPADKEQVGLVKPMARKYTEEPAELLDIAGSLISLKAPPASSLQNNQSSAFLRTRIPEASAFWSTETKLSQEHAQASQSLSESDVVDDTSQ